MSAPVVASGALPARVLEPRDAQSLSEAVRELGSRGEAALVRGAGTELPEGNLPARADVVLSTLALRGIETLDADEGVARVAAGTPVEALRDAAREVGLDVPLDPPSARSTIGGALAAAAQGPRSLGFGRARDAVLGLDVVLGSGERTRCGGRVVKNVTGYDLAKLYVGSLGTLAVLTHAWLRLRPVPEMTQVLIAVVSDGSASFEAALTAARLPGASAVALVDAPLAAEAGPFLPEAGEGRLVLIAELAADEPVVAAGATQLAASVGAERASEDAVALLRSIEGSRGEPRFADTLRFRVTSRAARLEAAYGVLRRAGAHVVVHPGLGLLAARFHVDPDAGTERIDACFAAANASAKAGEGSARLVAGPAAARAGRDVFGPEPEPRAILSRLRASFDPKRVLNPGIMAGRIA